MNSTNKSSSGIAYGNKYDSKLQTVEIAKHVRADIKAAVKEGKLPKGKYSVRSARFAGGTSLDIEATDLVGIAVYNTARFAAEIQNPNGWNGLPWMSKEAKAVQDQLSAMLQAYNFDGSDLQTDYYHVKFYGDAKVVGDREAELAAYMATVANDH